MGSLSDSTAIDYDLRVSMEDGSRSKGKERERSVLGVVRRPF